MLALNLVREVVVAGFAADAAPNTTAPAETLLFKPVGRVAGQGADGVTRSLGWYFRAVTATGAEVAAATISYEIWMRDQGASGNQSGSAAKRDQYVKVAADVATQGSSILLNRLAVMGDLFLRVTAISASTAVKYQLFAGELTQ
jgi:hypothetical protein